MSADSDEAVPLPPIEEEAQFEKTAGTPQEQSRISSESTRSSTSNIVDSVGRISLSSERSEEAPSQLQKSTSNDNFSIQNGTTQIPASQANGVDITSLQSRIAQLEQVNTTLRADKQKSDSAYNSLLHKVNDIRKSLTTRFQQNEEQLAANSETIERLESENQALTETVSTLQTEITSLSSENSTLSDQVSALRRDLSTRQANEAEWTRERNKLEKAKRQLESEVDNLRLALTNWERTASEEHSIAESSRDRIVLLEEEIASYRDHQDTARSEAERYREEADKLRHALREGQEERKRELREVVEGMEAQIDRLNIRVEQAERSATAAAKRLEEAQKELERLKPFEAEVKEKSALLGKTRHEAVILNEHLTKALRLLKRASPSSSVDKQVMTNFLLQFLCLPREDTKRYEILNLISSLLEWNEEQRHKAGLARTTHKDAGFRRINSNPMLSDYPVSPGERIESMSELWINFLQKEAEARGDGPGLVSPIGGSLPSTPTGKK